MNFTDRAAFVAAVIQAWSDYRSSTDTVMPLEIAAELAVQAVFEEQLQFEHHRSQTVMENPIEKLEQRLVQLQRFVKGAG